MRLKTIFFFVAMDIVYGGNLSGTKDFKWPHRVAAGQNSNPKASLPASATNTQNPNDRTISPRESLSRITVPEGFQVALFAAEPHVAQPIAMAFDDRGRLWVAECYSHPHWKATGHDRILIFSDNDGDGEFDARKIFWDRGNYLTGLALGHGGVWICNTPNLMFIPDRDRDDVPDGPPEILLDGWEKKNHNNVLNNLNWGPDGWLYGSIGNDQKSLVGKPGTPQEKRTEISRGIWRFHPQTKNFEVVALGAVNPWGLDFDDWGQAFFTNCVLAHLWHVVPGAYYQRREYETDNPFAYSRIDTVADHLHWGDGHWTNSRHGGPEHSVAGGGHAHTGAMIYLGDNWPDRYRNTFFTGNIHGNRINNDQLVRFRSGYVGRHRPDFLMGNHAWFRCLWQKYGPDGGVFIGDWHDFGECHDSDGSHRTSGRIYKITYGPVKPIGQIDLAQESDSELVNYQLHHNDWYVRHARRILHERSIAGRNLAEVQCGLRRIFAGHDDVTRKLRALWALYVTGGASESFLVEQLSHPNEHIRSWSIRLLGDRAVPSTDAIDRFTALATNDPSAMVRLQLASTLQRLPLEIRWSMAHGLVSHTEDAGDQNIPHMIWYAIEPAIASDTTRALQLLRQSQLPLVRKHIAHRIAGQLDALVQFLTETESTTVQADVLAGMLKGLRGRRNLRPPDNWPALARRLAESPHVEIQRQASHLGLLLNHQASVQSLQQTALDRESPFEARENALRALAEQGTPGQEQIFLALLHDKHLGSAALRGLATYDLEDIPHSVLKLFPRFDASTKSTAIDLLASRPVFALALLDAVESGVVNRAEISVVTARQINSLKNDVVRQRLKEVWGEVRQTAADKRDLIAKYKHLLNGAYLADADPRRGRLVYDQACGKCHRLFGQGGQIGPDLTGSNRKNLHYVLEHSLDPSAVVGKDYQLTTVHLENGRTVNGIVVSRTNERLVMQTIDEQVVVSTNDIDETEESDVSMMPEGLLEKMSRSAIRDLIAYLASPEQVPLSQSDEAKADKP